VNAIAPGIVDTKMAKVRLNTPELRKKFEDCIPTQELIPTKAVAESVVFLSTPFANHINGEIMLVDGGLTARQALPINEDFRK